MDPLVGNTAHAVDEHIHEDDLYNQLKFVAGVVFDFAYKQDLLPLTAPTSPQDATPAKPQNSEPAPAQPQDSTPPHTH